MALFKIEKGLSNNLKTNRPNTVEGWCYFTTDDGKFYIDTASAEGNTENRVALNSNKADRLNIADSIGDTGNPVYFNSEGQPVNCDFAMAQDLDILSFLSKMNYAQILASSDEIYMANSDQNTIYVL